MDGDSVVEVHRVPHPAERTLTDALDPSVEREDATGRVRPPALTLLQRLRTVFVTKLTGADRDLFAPLLTGTARDVRDHRRAVVDEEDRHLLGQIDLGVVHGLRVRSARLDDDRLLHPLPHFVSDLAGRFVTRRLQHQLLERPHRGASETAELTVDGARVKAEFLQSGLHGEHVIAVRALVQRRCEMRRDGTGRRRWRGHRGHRCRGGGRDDHGRTRHHRAVRAVASCAVGTLPCQPSDDHGAEQRHGRDGREYPRGGEIGAGNRTGHGKLGAGN